MKALRIALLAVSPLLAQQDQSSEAYPEYRKPQRVERPAAATGQSSVAVEVFRNVIVPPGKTVSLDSKTDFTQVAKVAVSVRCTACNSASTSLGSLVMQAFWTVPNAELFSVVESKSGTAFPYWDSGGALFEVYGTQFRLTFLNKGTQSISLSQVVLYPRMF